MKKLLMFSCLLILFSCGYKKEIKIQLNENDSSQYNSEIIKLTDSSSKLALNNHLVSSLIVLNKAVDLQKYLIKYRNNVKRYEDHKEFQKAINETLFAIKKLPNFADGYYKLGILYIKINQKHKSDDAFKIAKKLYQNKVEGVDTDRNRHINYINLIKIDIYTENANNAEQKIAEFTRIGSGITQQDSVSLSGFTKSYLLNRTELAIN